MTNKSKKEISQQTQEEKESLPVEKSSLTVKPDAKKEKKKKVSNKPKKEKQSRPILGAITLMFIVVTSTVMVLVYFTLQNQQQLNEVFISSQNSFEKEIKKTQLEVDKERASVKKLESEFFSFKVAMEALATKLGRTSNEWRLAEIEYLLTIANHRITLAKDLVTAITIFETADQRIKLLGDPALLTIRKSIKDELLSLRGVQLPDLAGMALSLGSLASEVENLPLIDKERVSVATGEIKDQAPESWRDIPATVWKDIKSLVVVRRHQKATEPLLPPSESWFLYQNLRLKLEQARLSLLRRDTGLFHQNLKEADAWIKTFFNEESSSVISALKQISTLVEIELQPASPDVSGSLLQLRSLLAERGVKIGRK